MILLIAIALIVLNANGVNVPWQAWLILAIVTVLSIIHESSKKNIIHTGKHEDRSVGRKSR